MLLGRWHPDGGARAKATWIDDMFKVLRTKYRRIRGLIWFDQVDRGVQWPLETAAGGDQGLPPAASASAASRTTPTRAWAASRWSRRADPERRPSRRNSDGTQQRSLGAGFGIRQLITIKTMKPPTKPPCRRHSRRLALLAASSDRRLRAAAGKRVHQAEAPSQAALLGRRDRQAADRRIGPLGLSARRSLRGDRPQGDLDTCLLLPLL